MSYNTSEQMNNTSRRENGENGAPQGENAPEGTPETDLMDVSECATCIIEIINDSQRAVPANEPFNPQPSASSRNSLCSDASGSYLSMDHDGRHQGNSDSDDSLTFPHDDEEEDDSETEMRARRECLTGYRAMDMLTFQEKVLAYEQRKYFPCNLQGTQEPGVFTIGFSEPQTEVQGQQPTQLQNQPPPHVQDPQPTQPQNQQEKQAEATTPPSSGDPGQGGSRKRKAPCATENGDQASDDINTPKRNKN